MSGRAAALRSPSWCTTAPITASRWSWPRPSRWGVKAGVDPAALFGAIRQGSLGRQRAVDRMTDQFLPHEFDNPAFALELAHKDVSLATALGRENDVPMRFANMTLAEMTEALNKGWGKRDSRVAMLIQEERAGLDIRVPRSVLQDILKNEPL
ncbi:MAG: NAD-binding protein [Bradyrhizobium sp.]